jgi:hypothetical protein
LRGASHSLRPPPRVLLRSALGAVVLAPEVRYTRVRSSCSDVLGGTTMTGHCEASSVLWLLILPLVGCGGLALTSSNDAGSLSGSLDGTLQPDKDSSSHMLHEDGGPCGALGQPCCRQTSCGDPLSCRGDFCGCGTSADCPATGECQPSGRCLLTLASDEWYPVGVAVDATNVYWVNAAVGGNGSVMTVPLNGGNPTTLASGQAIQGGLAVDDASIYWTTSGPQLGAVLKMSKGGGSPSAIASGRNYLYSVAVMTTTVFWTAYGAVVKADVDGGMIVTLAAVVSGADGLDGIAVDTTAVYWTNDSALLMRSPLTGGTAITLADEANIFPELALDSGNVYWSAAAAFDTMTGGTVMRVPKDGGAPVTIASNQDDPQGVAVDATSVYWVVGNDLEAGCVSCGAVLRAPLSGGAPTTLTTEQVAPQHIAVDDTSVYWTNYNNYGQVMKLTPK